MEWYSLQFLDWLWRQHLWGPRLAHGRRPYPWLQQAFAGNQFHRLLHAWAAHGRRVEHVPQSADSRRSGRPHCIRLPTYLPLPVQFDGKSRKAAVRGDTNVAALLQYWKGGTVMGIMHWASVFGSDKRTHFILFCILIHILEINPERCLKVFFY